MRDAERSTKRNAKSMAARDEPGGFEPAIGLAVIRQPVPNKTRLAMLVSVA